MKKKISLLILFCFLATQHLFSQTKATTPAQPQSTNSQAQAVKTVLTRAKTKDGKTVVLYTDGTWVFENQDQESTEKKQTVLSLTAAVITNRGSVLPVAASDFVIFDKDVAQILLDAGLTGHRVPGLPPDDIYKPNSVLIRLNYALSLKDYNFLTTARNALAPHAKYKLTTDLFGKAALNDIKPGDYYISGGVDNALGIVIWNLPITIKEGENLVTLTNNNAVLATGK